MILAYHPPGLPHCIVVLTELQVWYNLWRQYGIQCYMWLGWIA